MENYICIHGHFYQPPRENPWLEAIEVQESAQPYHDWNQRVSAECYAPNGVARILDDKGYITRIVNNYSRISFNFGPTLLSWLEAEEPETYARILEADRESRIRFSGHGSAMAQCYNHAILPLCNPHDKFTQILWGIRDFVRRFGRQPEGMWLPETAVDLPSLDIMAQQGIKFALLAPHQAQRFRTHGENNWKDTASHGIDTSMVYEINLSDGRTMALFFYDGAISSAVGFQKLLSSGSDFANRLMGGFSQERNHPQLVHMAVDGETFGHHHHFGEMALAWALDRIESEEKVRLTNYGEFLERHPSTHQVEIRENSSWSCSHGVNRWCEDCGCATGANPGWQQHWRAPLRRALNDLRDRLEPLYVTATSEFIYDPWNARNDYIELIRDRSPETIDRFLSIHALRQPAAEERVRILKLLEMQHQALLMFTSCGWFFDDLAGIETLQVLQYADRALQLAGELFGEYVKDTVESSFLEILREAKSNRPEMGDGSDLYRRFVKPAAIDAVGIAAHYALRTLFQDFPERANFYSCIIERRNLQDMTRGDTKLVIGSCLITSIITTETVEVEFAALHSWNAPGKAQVCLKVAKTFDAPLSAVDEIRSAFEKYELSTVLNLMNEYFADRRFEIKDLIRDERQKIMACMFNVAEEELDRLERQAFDGVVPMVDFMLDSGATPSPRFAAIAAAQLHTMMLDEFHSRPVQVNHIQSLLETADARNVKWDWKTLEPEIRHIIEQLAREALLAPESSTALRNFTDAVRAAKTLPFAVDLHETQTTGYFLLKNYHHELESMPVERLEELRALGELLLVKLE